MLGCQCCLSGWAVSLQPEDGVIHGSELFTGWRGSRDGNHGT